MKITLRTVFDPQKTEIETQCTTLGALLEELSADKKIKTAQFYDRGVREIYPDCDVIINKRALTEGLNTGLKDGDEVEINLVVPGGG